MSVNKMLVFGMTTALVAVFFFAATDTAEARSYNQLRTLVPDNIIDNFNNYDNETRSVVAGRYCDWNGARSGRGLINCNPYHDKQWISQAGRPNQNSGITVKLGETSNVPLDVNQMMFIASSLIRQRVPSGGTDNAGRINWISEVNASNGAQDGDPILGNPRMNEASRFQRNSRIYSASIIGGDTSTNSISVGSDRVYSYTRDGNSRYWFGDGARLNYSDTNPQNSPSQIRIRVVYRSVDTYHAYPGNRGAVYMCGHLNRQVGSNTSFGSCPERDVEFTINITKAPPDNVISVISCGSVSPTSFEPGVSTRMNFSMNYRHYYIMRNGPFAGREYEYAPNDSSLNKQLSTYSVVVTDSSKVGDPSSRLFAPNQRIAFSGSWPNGRGTVTTGSNITISERGQYNIRWKYQKSGVDIRGNSPAGHINGPTIDCGSGSPPPTITVASKPYVKVINGDVNATAALPGPDGSCGASGGNVRAFNRGSAANYAGASAQGAVYTASGSPQEFLSAALRTDGIRPRGLTFANTLISGTAPTYGASSGMVTCLPDYWEAQSSESDIPGNTSNITGQTVVRRNGDIYITRDITYSSAAWTKDSVPSFWLITDGDIYIDPSVSRLDGVYVARGKIYTCALGTTAPTQAQIIDPAVCGARKLTVNGTFIASDIKLLRSCGTVGNAGPTDINETCNATSTYRGVAEIFNATPELWISSPQELRLRTDNRYDAVYSLPPVL